MTEPDRAVRSPWSLGCVTVIRVRVGWMNTLQGASREPTLLLPATPHVSEMRGRLSLARQISPRGLRAAGRIRHAEGPRARSPTLPSECGGCGYGRGFAVRETGHRANSGTGQSA